jgi:hypothetical protein
LLEVIAISLRSEDSHLERELHKNPCWKGIGVPRGLWN